VGRAGPTTSSPQDDSTWSYTVLEPGSYLWSSPHGHQFLRDHDGTHDISTDPSLRTLPDDRGSRSTLDVWMTR
jgi:hypothetical protein